MKNKISLAIVASLLSASAVAATTTPAPANSNLYISVAGGAAVARHDAYYPASRPMNAGYDLSAAVGYTFAKTSNSDVRVELQYMHTHNSYSKKLKTWLNSVVDGTYPDHPISPTGGTIENGLGANYFMVNALYDWKFNPQFSMNAGIGAGYAHLSAMIDNGNFDNLDDNSQSVLSAENTWATSLILGGQYNLSQQVSVGASYEALLTSSARAGTYYTIRDGSITSSSGMLLNNLINVSLSYALPM
jgi:opacity protein-like surface antigen